MLALTPSVLLVCLLFTCSQGYGQMFSPDSCRSEFFCQGTCNDRIGSAPGLQRGSCRCDRLCTIYGDCCQDYTENCLNDTHNDIVEVSRFHEYTACVSQMGPRIPTSSYYAVNRCPPSWPADWVRDSCENETRAKSERFLTLFITGPDNYVFKNVYCGLCHGVELKDLTPWVVNVTRCTVTGNGQVHIEGVTYDFGSCQKYLLSPPKLQGSDPHLCFPDVVSSCPTCRNTSSLLVSPTNQCYACENVVATLYQKANKLFFKNIDCCECTKPAVQCQDLNCRFILSQSTGFGSSLGLIFNFFYDHEMHSTGFELRSNYADDVDLQLGNCSSGQIYDPFDHVCRRVKNEDSPFLKHLEPDTAIWTNQSGNATLACLAVVLPPELHEILTAINVFTLAELIQYVPGLHQINLANNSNKLLALYTNPSFEASTKVLGGIDYIMKLSANQTGSLLCGVDLIVVMVSSNHVGQAKVVEIPTCKGYTIVNISLSNLYFLDDSFYVRVRNDSYRQKDLIHTQTYNIHSTSTGTVITQRQTLKLCNPFLVDGITCDEFITYKQEDFEIQGSDSQTLVLSTSKKAYKSGQYWLLPDRSVVICNSPSKTELFPESLHTLSNIGGTLSIIALAAAIITHAIFPSLRTLPGKCLMQLMIAMCVAQVALLLEGITLPWLCSLRALVLHASWLVVFMWMNVLTGHLAFKMKRQRIPNRHVYLEAAVLWKFGLYAWGGPVVFVTGCFTASSFGEGRPGWLQYGGNFCWIVDPYLSFLLFGIPVLLVVVVNAVLLAYMMKVVLANKRSINQVGINRQQMRISKQKSDMLLCLKLCIMTGVPWSTFFLANLTNSPIVWYASIMINSLQGVFLFLTFTCKKNVRNLWRQRITSVIRRGDPNTVLT